MRYIILSQIIKKGIPSTTNNIVALMKDISLVMVIGLSDLTYKANRFSHGKFFCSFVDGCGTLPYVYDSFNEVCREVGREI